MKINPRIGIVVVFASVFCLLTGCSEEKKKPHMQEVTGTIENISANKVTVRSFSKKHNKELKFDVEVNDETEILINGSIASIKDLKIGETAFGSVRIVENDDDTKTITAVKVRVERAEVLKAPPAASGTDDATADTETKDDAPTEDDGGADSDHADDGGE
ncbi:MAG: hypothetical protein R3E58_03780 [Phycisphaerae bacterium]|nr:hypothetical protein [Phycisphaerales bacterium]